MDEDANDEMDGNGNSDGRTVDAEIAMYRLAAELTLEQIEWVVHYLRRSGKKSIAEVLDKNRQRIQREMRRKDD